MSSSSAFDDSQPSASEKSDQRTEFSARIPQAKLLEQILTAAEGQSGDDQSAKQLQAELLAVVQRFGPDHPLDSEVVAAMVSVLTDKIKGLGPPLQKTLVEWVAETLFDDQLSRNRLNLIWAQLTGRNGNGE